MSKAHKLLAGIAAPAIVLAGLGTVSASASAPPAAKHRVIVAEFFRTNLIHAFDGDTGAHLGVLASGELIQGPIGMRLGPDGAVFVANATTSDIVRLDPESGVAERFVTGNLTNPYDLVFAPDGSLVVTSLGSNEIVRFDGRTGTLLGKFSNGDELDWPEGLAFGPDGDLYVSSSRTNQVLRYDGETGTFVEALDTGDALEAPAGLLFDEAGELLIASNGNHSIVRFGDGGVETLVAPESAGMQFPKLMSFGPDGLLYVSAGKRLLRFDAVSGAFVDEFATTQTSVVTGFVFAPYREGREGA